MHANASFFSKCFLNRFHGIPEEDIWQKGEERFSTIFGHAMKVLDARCLFVFYDFVRGSEKPICLSL